jgi:spermidine synthase
MIPREVIDRGTTPEGKPFELVRERGHLVLRIDGQVLMSSQVHGSEGEMARLAATLAEPLPSARRPGEPARRVLIGGLGMGYTLRAALEAFEPDAAILVAELLPEVVAYGRGVLADLSGRALEDARVQVHLGDVREPLAQGPWSAVLLDVDNGPDALTVTDNRRLYDDEGCTRIARALAPGGVVVGWSASENRPYEQRLRRAGLRCTTHQVRARAEVRKGSAHTLFVGRAPGCRKGKG